MKLLRALFFLVLLVSCSSENPGSTANPSDSAPTESAENTTHLDVQGHRGARGLKPENTLPGFETALDLGVSTLEIDLHYSADNKVVIWHDDRIKNNKCELQDTTQNAPDPDTTTDLSLLLIRNLTVQQLKAYQCNLNPDPSRFQEQKNSPTILAVNNYTIQTLAELFEFVKIYSTSESKTDFEQSTATSVKFNLETKRRPTRPEVINDGFDGVNPGEFELEILRLIDQFNLEQRVIIQSFDFRSLWAIATVRPSITLSALTNSEKPDLNQLSSSGADIWSPNVETLEASDIELAHQLSMKVIPWTVNDAQQIERVIDMGVDGIITDYPDRVLSQLQD